MKEATHALAVDEVPRLSSRFGAREHAPVRSRTVAVRAPARFGLEHPFEAADRLTRHGLDRRGGPPERGQRGDAVLRDPARHDEPEPREVGRHVEGEAVHRDPARELHADRPELRRAGRAARLARVATPYGGAVLIHPHPDELRVPLEEARGDALLARQVDHHARQIAHVAPHVAAVGVEIEDRIGHELPGAVKGDVASPARLVQIDAELLEPAARQEHVLLVGAAPEGHDRLVLEEEQRVADRSANARLDEPLLQGERLCVADPPQPPRLEASHRSASKVIGGLFGDDDVVHVALAKPLRGNANEARVVA